MRDFSSLGDNKASFMVLNESGGIEMVHVRLAGGIVSSATQSASVGTDRNHPFPVGLKEPKWQGWPRSQGTEMVLGGSVSRDRAASCCFGWSGPSCLLPFRSVATEWDTVVWPVGTG